MLNSLLKYDVLEKSKITINNFSSTVTKVKIRDTNAFLVSLYIYDKKMFNFSHWKPNKSIFCLFSADVPFISIYFRPFSIRFIYCLPLLHFFPLIGTTQASISHPELLQLNFSSLRHKSLLSLSWLPSVVSVFHRPL